MQITLADYKEALHIATYTTQRTEAVRDSFHSLIGDFWIKGMTLGRFPNKAVSNSTAPLLALWDSQVPIPNAHTILAWFLTCETGVAELNNEIELRPRVLLPNSVDPYGFSVQRQDYEAQMTHSRLLPYMERLKPHMTNQMRENLPGRNIHGEPSLWTAKIPLSWADGGGSEPDRLLLPDAPDDVYYGESYIHQARLNRIASLMKVLTPPACPTSFDNLSCGEHGLHIRSWTESCLAVQPSTPVAWDGNQAKARMSSERGSKAIQFVPLITPPLWVGFNESTDAGKDAVREWLKAYFFHRNRVIRQLNRLEDYEVGVVNPDWMVQLSEAGLINAQTPKKESSAAANREAMNNALEGIFGAFK